MIDPSGVGRRIDVGSAGETERTTLNGGSDPSVLVVRGYESSVGSFTISASQVERTVLLPGIPQDGQLEPEDPPVEYAVAAQRDGLVAIVQPDEAVDMAVEVVGTDETSQFSDWSGPGGVEMVSSVAAGELVFRVVGFDQQGGFVVRAVEPRPLAVATRDTVSASAAAFDVDVDGTDALVLTASPQSETAVVDVWVFDPDGFVVASERSPQDGETVSVIVDDFGSEVPGIYRVAVASNEPDDQITTTLEAISPRRSPQAQPTRWPPLRCSTWRSTGTVCWSSPLPRRRKRLRRCQDLLIPTATRRASRSNLSGDPVTVAVDSFGAGLPGTYRLAVTSTEPDDRLSVALNQVTARRLDIGGSDPVAAPAAFDVSARPGEPIAFTAAPGTDSAFVDVTVYDPGGFPIASARSLEGGNPACRRSSVARFRRGLPGHRHIDRPAWQDHSNGCLARVGPADRRDARRDQRPGRLRRRRRRWATARVHRTEFEFQRSDRHPGLRPGRILSQLPPVDVTGRARHPPDQWRRSHRAVPCDRQLHRCRERTHRHARCH